VVDIRDFRVEISEADITICVPPGADTMARRRNRLRLVAGHPTIMFAIGWVLAGDYDMYRSPTAQCVSAVPRDNRELVSTFYTFVPRIPTPGH